MKENVKGGKMKENGGLIWIVFDEQVADFLASCGETVTFWGKKLSELYLEKRDDVIFRLLVPTPLLGVALGFLRRYPFVELATISARRPTIPWWAKAKEVRLSFFREAVWIITFNEEADLSRYLRR